VTDGLTNLCTENELKDLFLNYSGRKLIENAHQLFARPLGILDSYIKYNQHYIVDLVARGDERFIDMQKEIFSLPSTEEKFERIEKAIRTSGDFRNLVLQAFREEKAQSDDFTIIAIEMSGDLKLKIRKTFGLG
jgi:hypothetical protein